MISKDEFLKRASHLSGVYSNWRYDRHEKYNELHALCILTGMDIKQDGYIAEGGFRDYHVTIFDINMAPVFEGALETAYRHVADARYSDLYSEPAA
jgi:hypothetical protein